ncbi:MAG: PAS domain S-box protein [Candidatus Fermentibacteraceae bacterium]
MTCDWQAGIVEFRSVDCAGGGGTGLNSESADLKRRITELQEKLGALQAENKRLLEVESLLDALAELSRAIFWETDANGLITKANSVSEAVLGYSPEELMGRMHFYDLYPEGGREAFRASAFEAYARREVFHNLVNPATTRDGHEVLLLTNGVPVFSPERKFMGYRGIDVDVTDRMKSEEALRIKNYAFHSSIAANGITDTNAVVTEVNDAFLRIWGYGDRSDVIGRSITHFLANPEERDQFFSVMGRKGEWEGDFTARRSDGTSFTAHGLTTVLLDENGRHIGYQSSVIDVSRNRLMESRLRESEARNKALLNALPDIIFILNGEGVFVDYHASSEARLLIPPDVFLGRSIEEVLPGEIAENTLSGIEAVCQGRDATPFRYEARMGSEIRYFESRIVACSEDRFLSIVRDITDLRRAELEQEQLQAQLRQAHKMESVGRLAGGVAHDFNNMLGVIIGHNEMAMEKTPPSSPVMADLMEIQQSAERSAELTRQLLAFARRQSVSPRVLDLNKALDGMLNMLRRLIGENVTLEWLPGKDLWPVLVDAAQMSQMLANLCINARQSLPGTGRITITTGNITLRPDFCSLKPGSHPGDHVQISISDNGCGMDRETIDQIFEPFFTTRKQGQGTGLGLSTVYGIVKQSNGYIDVESEPGQGTTFRVYFPRSTTPEETFSSESDLSMAPGGHETIILVEDERSILDMVATMLSKLGYEVLSTSSPSEAVEMARKHRRRIRLLITDVVMPELNGRDLAWSLKSIIPNLKCLFMSGYTSEVIAHQGILADGVHFIPKPFTSRGLAASVRKALSDR